VRIDFHPAATEELTHSADWYQQRSQTAAQRFAVAIDEAISKIAAVPDRFLAVDSRHRACSVRDFPFQIVFRQEGDRIYVIAIAHAKRRSDYWRSRK